MPIREVEHLVANAKSPASNRGRHTTLRASRGHLALRAAPRRVAAESLSRFCWDSRVFRAAVYPLSAALTYVPTCSVQLTLRLCRHVNALRMLLSATEPFINISHCQYKQNKKIMYYEISKQLVNFHCKCYTRCHCDIFKWFAVLVR